MAWSQSGRHRRSRYVGTERGIYRVIRSARIDMGEFAENNLHGAPINVATVLPRQDGDMRAVEHSDRSRSNRRLNVEKGRRQVRPVRRVDGKGMRMSTALLCLTVIGLSLMFLSLNGLAQVSRAQKEVSRLEASLEYNTDYAADMQRRYENAAANANISEVAREMGLISSKSVPAVELTVWEEAIYMPSNDTLVLPADTLATILGN